MNKSMFFEASENIDRLEAKLSVLNVELAKVQEEIIKTQEELLKYLKVKLSILEQYGRTKV